MLLPKSIPIKEQKVQEANQNILKPQDVLKDQGRLKRDVRWCLLKDEIASLKMIIVNCKVRIKLKNWVYVLLIIVLNFWLVF